MILRSDDHLAYIDSDTAEATIAMGLFFDKYLNTYYLLLQFIFE